MNITSITNLLEKARHHFEHKQFDAALHISNKVLASSEKESYPTGIIQSSLLLANIYNTKGNYAGDEIQISKALNFLNNIERFEETDWATQMNVLYTKGKVFYYKSDFEKAKSLFLQLEKQSALHEDAYAKCLSKIALSEWAMAINDFQAALLYAKKAQVLIENNLNINEGLKTDVYVLLAQIYIKSHDYASSLKYNEKLLQISRANHDIENETIALKNLGIVYGAKADLKESMAYFLEALDKAKQLNYRKQIAQIQINIATIYANLYNYQEALDRYRMALEDYSDVISQNVELITLNNVGNIYYEMNRFEEALPYFEKANDLAQKGNYQEMIAHTLSQISRTHTALGDLETAFEFAQKAQTLIDELGEINGRQINLINLGEILFRKKQYNDASRLISQGAVIAKRLDDNASEIRAYKLLSALFEAQKDFEKAFQYQKVYAIIQAKFSQVQRNRLTLDMEISYSIKEKQKAIEQLKTENKLQALLLERQDQISRQNEQLTEANEELKQFAYVASHDLKEPLRMIGSYTQLINRTFAKTASEETQLYFDYVNGGVKRMNALLDALLQYATIGRISEENKMVNLEDIVAICCLHLKLRIDETKAKIHYEKLPKVFAIRSLMMQLFQNLISNAIKFRKPDVAPEVFISCQEQEQDYLISVRDNGIGISTEHQDRIFVIFQRLHRRKDYEGTGIGLAICHKIIKRMKGNIWVESELGAGATFFFTIPKVS